MGELLGLDYGFVASRAARVQQASPYPSPLLAPRCRLCYIPLQAFSEWRSPELLFRYLDDNRHDAKMRELIARWLRSIFGLSDETLREIRRESPQNIVHLLHVPQHVLLRWFSERCPGTSKCKTLFMLGEARARAWTRIDARTRARARTHGRAHARARAHAKRGAAAKGK